MIIWGNVHMVAPSRSYTVALELTLDARVIYEKTMNTIRGIIIYKEFTVRNNDKNNIKGYINKTYRTKLPSRKKRNEINVRYANISFQYFGSYSFFVLFVVEVW